VDSSAATSQGGIPFYMCRRGVDECKVEDAETEGT